MKDECVTRLAGERSRPNQVIGRQYSGDTIDLYSEERQPMRLQGNSQRYKTTKERSNLETTDVPIIRPGNSVQIDGSIDLSQNFALESPPDDNNIPSEIADIIAKITSTADDVRHMVRRSNIPSEYGKKVKKTYDNKSNPLMLNDLQDLAPSFRVRDDDDEFNDKKPIYRKPKKKLFITHKTYDPNIVRITKQMHYDFKREDYTKNTDRKRRHRTTRQRDIKDYSRKERFVTKNNKNKHQKRTSRYSNYEPEWTTDAEPVKSFVDGTKLIQLLEKFGVIKGKNTLSAPEVLRIKNEPQVYNNLNGVHLVKDDLRIRNFTLDVFKQNIDVFEQIKGNEINPNIKSKIDVIARSYRNKFGNFVKESQNQKVVTRLGTQKVVLNTIETSNHIMRRLLNFLIGDMEKKGYIHDKVDLTIAWRTLMENEEQLEYLQACQKFKICRSKYSLSSFIAEFFTVLLQVDDMKLKQGIDAFTEVIKETDLSKIIDMNMEKRFRSNIDMMERAEPKILRPLMWMFKNMLINKNQPLVVHDSAPRVVSQSVALMDVIDILDERISATEDNVLEWNDLRNSLVQWANGQRHDILDIMQAFVGMLVRKGVNKLNNKVSEALRQKVTTFLRASTS